MYRLYMCSIRMHTYIKETLQKKSVGRHFESAALHMWSACCICGPHAVHVVCMLYSAALNYKQHLASDFNTMVIVMHSIVVVIIVRNKA